MYVIFSNVYNSHKERVLISSNPCRKLLMKIVNNNNLTDQQFRELIQQLTAHCPTVVHFVNWIRFSYETFSNPPKSIKSFVRAVAASLPVCALIKPNEAIHSLVRELIDGKMCLVMREG